MGQQDAGQHLSGQIQMPKKCAGVAATNRAAAKQFGIELLKRGLFLHPASKLYVSTAHTGDQIEFACKAAYEAMRTIRDNGLIK